MALFNTLVLWLSSKRRLIARGVSGCVLSRFTVPSMSSFSVDVLTSDKPRDISYGTQPEPLENKDVGTGRNCPKLNPVGPLRFEYGIIGYVVYAYV